MATPIITGITVLYAGSREYKHPGEPATIIVDAIDADNEQFTVTVTVADSHGNETSQSKTIAQADPLTYAATTSAAGHTVTGGANPNEFIVV